ncbi:Multidrug efflux pump subunit AcrB [Prosthecobacter debontii]|uniref:Multidrug efflux pump subunit AcrB n=1 Tax=Prosthecobacter debontii TaxID=48467 RepID=A0A1T4YUL0_9BACT|nr:efflux RND transporter permease subunit [Prosthecobacter debontii]SKB04915.1 Multidrug efflux pump subunit AcrB [Prosthecobacter debontii]
MSLARYALRHPWTVLVAVVAVCLGAWLALQRMTRDIFPPLGIPTIYVAQPYGGMDPLQMEGYLTYRYEYHFLYIANIEHVESKSIQGASIMKLQFHPGTDMSQAMSETVAQVNRSRAFMPPGTVAPFIMRFDAGSVAVGHLVFSTDDPNISLNQMQDQALNRVRPAFATLPGVSAPPPFGGSSRAIVVNVNPDRMKAYGLSPDEIVQAIARGNPISPSGNINLDGRYPIVPTNAIVSNVKDLEAVPLKKTEAGAVFIRDVATVADGADVTTSYALANGKRTVYLPVTKRAEASTLEVVKRVREAVPEFQKLLPDGIKVSFEFDQTPVVNRSIQDLVKEGALGAVLTGLMVLIFLRDLRTAFIVVINIPLALLASAFGLWISGQNIHLMTLGGLALAVGILVDEATVTVENIHTHLARGKPLARAALEGTLETTQPRLLAMLCILAVFIPAFFMEGAAKALFVPLALAVGFAMLASFLLSSTLVPVLSVWFLPTKQTLHEESLGFFARSYQGVVKAAVAMRWILVPAYLAGAGLIIVSFGPFLGTEIFPKTDSGQFAIRFRAPSGTQVATTEKIAQKILHVIEHDLGEGVTVDFSLGMVGVHNSSFPVNLVHLWNGGPEEGWLAVQMKPGRMNVEEIEEKLRAILARELPEVRLSFEPQDIVSRVMSFGASTPIEIAVSGPSLPTSKEHAEKILAKLKELPFLRDVQIAQTLDAPTVNVQIDRERAGLLGVEVEDVTRSLVAATTSSRFTTPVFWADPGTGISFNVQVQIPEERTQSLEDLGNVPVTSKLGNPVLLRNLAKIEPGTAVGTYERYNLVRLVSVTANIHDRDFGSAIHAVNQALKEIGPAPDGKTKVDVRGQVVPYNQLYEGFSRGLVIAIVVIFLLLCANFQSLRLALVVISTMPAVIAGVVLALFFTGTTVNIQSAMGAIMAVGVAVANAILLVSFADRARREKQGDRHAAAVEGAVSRLRPILMTSFAMMAGMMPLALGAGQTAPLGRAVVGGLALATVATLLFLPSVFALLASRKATSASLDPDDENGALYEGRA